MVDWRELVLGNDSRSATYDYSRYFNSKPLAKLASEGMRESAIRNAMLVESVQGIEDIKLLRAESRFQNQWNHMNEVSADISMRQRKLVGVMMAWTQKYKVWLLLLWS